MNSGVLLAVFVISIAVSAIIFWISAKVLKVPCSIADAAIIVGIPRLLFLIPTFGWVLAIVAFFTLIAKRLDTCVATTVLLCVTNGVIAALLRSFLMK